MLGLASTLVFAANFACYSVLAPHQQQRIKIWLRPGEAEANARGSGYNLIHSKMAIGAGGIFGKGPLQGNMTKLKYVPKQSTDYIFCTVGEEHGFIGEFSTPRRKFNHGNCEKSPGPKGRSRQKGCPS